MTEETLFHLALEKPPPERSAFLDGACAGDAELRRRVQMLLRAHDDPGSFLQKPALQSTGTSPDEATRAFDASARPADGDQTHTEPQHPAGDDLAFLTPSQRPDSLGRLEHYEILQVIGKGGFGTVLKAFDDKLHRVVAIKVLSLELSASGTARQRFIREARTAAAVTHDHVVTIHAVVEDHRPPYLVMQMIDGVTLQQKLERTGTLGLKEVLRIGSQMAEGLAAAHKQGLVHRDIKPANILLENGIERVKITDFGLARAVDDASVTQSGTVAGTPMYMSPEQAEGVAIDHRSDLFSLGTVLYAMCTGHPPFRASGTHAVLKRVIDASPRPIREINNEVPEWLCDIIAKLHAKKPEDRFQTAKEVAKLLGQRLADVQAGRPIERAGSVSDDSLRPAPTVAHASGSSVPRRSRPAWLGLGAVAVLGLGFTLGGAVLLATPQSSLTDQGRLFAPIQLVGGLSILAWMVFFAARKSWLRWLAGTLAVLLGVAALVSPVVYQRLVPLPPPMAQLVVQTEAPNVRVEVIPVANADGKLDFPPQEAVGVLLDRQVPVGNWKVIAYKGDKIHYQTEFALTANIQKFITVPPAPSVGAPIVEPGWVQLFNGKDLTGWRTHPDQRGQPGDWQVKDGELVGRGKTNHLFTERQDFADFHLRFEAKLKEGNSGVFFRSNFSFPFGAPQGRVPGGFEADFQNSGGLVLPGVLHYRGAKPRLEQVNIKPDTWFTEEVIARGDRITLKVDGVTTAEFTDTERTYRKGALALQLYGPTTTVHFKTIEIKELPPEEPGWVQLFNGKDLDGWKEFDKGVWSVEKGELLSRPDGNLISLVMSQRDDLANFHLRGQAKLAAAEGQGKAGIWVRLDKELGGYGAFVSTGSGETGVLITSEKASDKLKTPAAKPAATIPLNTWFDFDIIADGTNITVKVNGTVTGQLTGATRRQGWIALERWRGTVVHFRKLEIKELPPSETAPFVILTKGKRAETKHATLADAVKAAQSGDSIEIRSNGPFETKPIDLGKKALSIRAGDGFRPHLKCQLTDPESKDSMLRSEGPLALEGLTLEMTGHADANTFASPTGVLTVNDAPVRIANCRLLAARLGSILQMNAVPDGLISNSILVEKTRNGGVTLVARPGASRFAMVNNVIFAGTALGLNVGPSTVENTAITLRGNTLVTHNNVAVWAHYTEVSPDLKVRFPLTMTDNVLATRRLFFFNPSATTGPLEKTATILPKLFSLQDDGNLYGLGQKRFLLVTRTGSADVQLMEGLKEWHEFWSIKKSTSQIGEPVFVGAERLPVAEVIGISPADFRLAPGSPGKGVGPAGKDLGADVDLVGPGAAYEKWKKTPEYLEWRKQTDALTDPGWMPLFNGKDTTGWKYHPKHPGEWTVKDGILTSGGKGGNYLYTARDDYADFHLRAEVKLEKGFTSAIFFRTGFGSTWEDSKMQPGLDGHNALISRPFDDNPTGSLRVTGMPFSVAEKGIVDAKDWFVLEIIAKGNRIESLVNGKPAATLVDKRKKGRFKKGHIALQMLNPDIVVRYRKIEIKELPAAPAAPSAKEQGK